MALFLPTRWTRQPPYPVRIDRSNPLCRGLQIAAYPIGGVMWDGVHGVVSTPVSAPTVAYRAPSMMAVQTDGTSSYQSFSLTPFGIDKSAGITLAMWEDVDVSSSVTYNNGIGVVCTGGVTYTNSAHGYMQPYYNSGATPQRGLQLVVPKSSDGSIQGSVGALTSGQLVGLQLYAVSSKYTAATTQAYWNGIPLAMTEAFTWAGTTWGTTVTELRVGGLVLQDTSYYGPTKATLALYWTRALTDAEHAELARNPWQVFAPLHRGIYFNVSTGTSYTLTANTGSFPITGTSATLKATRYLSASSGSHPISGTNATLTYTSGHTLAANSGSFPITGTTATLKVSRLLTAASGSHPISGTAATLFYGKQLTVASGSFPISGTAATFRRTYIMTASSGSVPITGTAATLTYAEVSSASTESGIITRLYCPVCDRRVRRSELRKRWDGLLVCPEDWEPRHPSTFYRQRPAKMQKVLPLPDSQPTLYTPTYANGWSVSGSVVDTGGYFVDGAGYTNVVIHPNPFDVVCLCTAGGTITTPNSVTTAGTGTIFNTKTGRLLSLVTIASGQITTATPFASTTDPIVVRGRYIH